MDVQELYKELQSYMDDIDVNTEGARLYSNYQKVTAYSQRLAEIRNDIAMLEIYGEASPELKKFRTMVLDPTLEELKKIANYESRKITAVGYELTLEGKR